MLFVFRTLNFCALGAIFLTPFWLFNSTLDRLLPHTPPVSAALSPRVDAATTHLRGQFVTALSSLKKEIHADVCRRDTDLCALAVCVPPAVAQRCP